MSGDGPRSIVINGSAMDECCSDSDSDITHGLYGQRTPIYAMRPPEAPMYLRAKFRGFEAKNQPNPRPKLGDLR